MTEILFQNTHEKKICSHEKKSRLSDPVPPYDSWDIIRLCGATCGMHEYLRKREKDFF